MYKPPKLKKLMDNGGLFPKMKTSRTSRKLCVHYNEVFLPEILQFNSLPREYLLTNLLPAPKITDMKTTSAFPEVTMLRSMQMDMSCRAKWKAR